MEVLYMETNRLLAVLLLSAEEINVEILSFDITGDRPVAILKTQQGIMTVEYDSETNKWV
jgi:hypothetical protein